MALLPTEAWQRGYIFDTLTGYPVITTSQSGATMWGGYLRDPDGRLVVIFV